MKTWKDRGTSYIMPLFPIISPADVQFVLLIKYCGFWNTVSFKFFSATASCYFWCTWWVPYFFVTGLSKFFGIALLQTRGAYLPLHFEAAMEIWQPVSLSSTANLNISCALYTDKPWNVLRMKEVNVQSSFGCNLSCYLHEPGITHLRCGIWPLNKRQVLMLC